MFENFNERTVSRFNFISLLLIVILLSVSSTYIFISFYSSGNKNRIETMEKQLLDTNMKKMSIEVIEQAGRINARRVSSETQVKEEIRRRVNAAYLASMGIYKELKDRMPDSEIKKIIIAALRGVTLQNYRHIMIHDLDGNVILNNAYKQIEGVNVIGKQDAEGNYFVKKFIKIAREKGEGYTDKFLWSSPDGQDDKTHESIVYLKKFEPYNWYIFTCGFMDATNIMVQKDIIKILNKAGENNDGKYFFVMEVDNGFQDAKIIINPKNPEMVNKKMSESVWTGAHKEILNTVVSEGKMFYKFYKTDTNGDKTLSSITFFYYMPAWKWIIAKSFDYREVQSALIIKNKEAEAFISNQLVYSAVILIVFVFISILISIFASKKLYLLVKGYRDQLEQWNKLMQKEIVDRKIAERNAVAAKEAKNKFIADMSLRMMNPVDEIIEAAKDGNMFASADSISSCGEKFTSIYESGRELKSFFRKIENIFRIKGGEENLYIENFPVRALVEESTEKFQSIIAVKNIKLEYDLDEFAQVRGDFKKLVYMFGTLIDNALGRSDDGGIVSIKAFKDNRYLKIIIEDSGKELNEFEKESCVDVNLGLSAADKRYIFMGYILSGEIAGLHKGSISLETPESGSGLRVSVSIPV